jgi:hypothetical protein
MQGTLSVKTLSVPSSKLCCFFRCSELSNLLLEIRKHQTILASDHGRPDACYRISSRISRVALARAAHSVHCVVDCPPISQRATSCEFAYS